MSPLTYRGYQAVVGFDPADGLLVGHLAGLTDVIGFHATDDRAFKQAFKEAVDDYIATCEQVGTPAD